MADPLIVVTNGVVYRVTLAGEKSTVEVLGDPEAGAAKADVKEAAAQGALCTKVSPGNGALGALAIMGTLVNVP